MLCDWDVQTYEYWLQVLDSEKQNTTLPKSGLKVRCSHIQIITLECRAFNRLLIKWQMYDSLHYWDGDITEDLWWTPYVKGYEQLSNFRDPLSSIRQRTPPHAPQIKHGSICRAMAINVPHYLQYLQDKSRALGVKIIKARLPAESGLETALRAAESLVITDGQSGPDCFVNATGLSAARLCGDEAMYPIRGQTVLVKGEAEATRTRIGEGYGAYCIARPGSGTTILGGTKEAGNWSGAVDPETTEKILERCSYIVPELQTAADGGFEVISVQCGLRPGRKGGPRVEKESIGDKKVVHVYGHAGAGYQNSIGSARLTVKLVDESLATPPPAARL